ncbi:hypothetical protein HDU82_002620, partial [Entophlyctis luteolus]
CSGIRKDGGLCRAFVQSKDAIYCCKLHDPVLSQEITSPEKFRKIYLHQEYVAENDKPFDRDCTDKLRTRESKAVAIEWLKPIVNSYDNLNPTDKDTNLVKFKAFRCFMSAFNADEVNPAGIVHYLREQHVLDRRVTGRIESEVKRSHDAILDKFQADKPFQTTIVDSYCDAIEKMKLN